MTRRNISSGSKWEPLIGYSRAVRVGQHVHVSGTTSPGVTIEAQTRGALDIIKKALEDAGATLADVVRTRIYTTDIRHWEAIGAVHGEVFGTIRPATAMLEVSRLIDPSLLVEIEADAFVAM